VRLVPDNLAYLVALERTRELARVTLPAAGSPTA
jgi:hypothetical protein